jgi:hypothetical protein
VTDAQRRPGRAGDLLRSCLAVLAGLALTVFLVIAFSYLAAAAVGIPAVGPPTSSYLLLNLLGSALAGAVGGATAVRLAPHRPHGHVILLAVIIVLLSLPTVLSAPAAGQPGWYALTISVLGPISVLAGGLLMARARPEGRPA